MRGCDLFLKEIVLKTKNTIVFNSYNSSDSITMKKGK